MTRTRPLLARLALLAPACALALACSDDGPPTTTEASSGSSESSGSESSGDGDPTTTGDGDGDPTTTGDSDGDGDGDPVEPCTFVWEATEMKDNGQVHFGAAVSVAPDGSFAVVGALDNGADRDAWIAKYDATGTKLWETSVDSGGFDGATGVVLDEAGEVYAIGSLGGGVNDELWLSKRSGVDGAELWSMSEASAFDGDNEPGSLALGPDGAILASGTIRAGDDDTDIWLRKLEPGDGSEMWTATYSGQADPNGFSIDRGGPLALAPDGTVFVGGSEGVDFETREAVVLAYAPDGGGGTPQWTLRPQASPDPHIHELRALAAGPEGEAYFVVAKTSGEWAFTLHRASAAGELEWALDEQSFVYSATKNWVVNGLALADDASHLSIAGNLRAEEIGQGIDWSEVWVADINLAGEGLCLAAHTWQNTHIIPASTYGFGFDESPGGTLAVGEIRDGPENYLWMGRFK